MNEEFGLACGNGPRPAPFWLHQSPRNGRLSTFVALTNVFRSVDVLAAVGRLGPPQPLREVSISIPMLAGNPALTKLVYIASS